MSARTKKPPGRIGGQDVAFAEKRRRKLLVEEAVGAGIQQEQLALGLVEDDPPAQLEAGVT